MQNGLHKYLFFLIQQNPERSVKKANIPFLTTEMKRSEAKEINFRTISLPTIGMDINRRASVIHYFCFSILQCLPSYYLFQVKKIQCLSSSLLQQISSLGIHYLASIYPVIQYCLVNSTTTTNTKTTTIKPMYSPNNVMLILASEYLLTKFPSFSFYLLKPYSCISTNSSSSIKHDQPIPIAFFL